MRKTSKKVYRFKFFGLNNHERIFGWKVFLKDLQQNAKEFCCAERREINKAAEGGKKWLLLFSKRFRTGRNANEIANCKRRSWFSSFKSINLAFSADENEAWQNIACQKTEKYSSPHFSSFFSLARAQRSEGKEKTHSGEKSTREIDQRGWFHIIKRPFIIQVIIKIVCIFCSLTWLPAIFFFGTLFFAFASAAHEKE